jgi:hypothetical protein
MSDRRPLPQGDYTPDPFADGLHARFQEPMPRPYESTASLPQDFGGQGQQYDDEEEIEKQPLTGGAAPGFYPPGCVEYLLKFVLSALIFSSQAGRPQYVWGPLCSRPSHLCCLRCVRGR